MYEHSLLTLPKVCNVVSIISVIALFAYRLLLGFFFRRCKDNTLFY